MYMWDSCYSTGRRAHSKKGSFKLCIGYSFCVSIVTSFLMFTGLIFFTNGIFYLCNLRLESPCAKLLFSNCISSTIRLWRNVPAKYNKYAMLFSHILEGFKLVDSF